MTGAMTMETPADIKKCAEKWKEKGFERFLDLGCGNGRNSLYFFNKGFQTTSIDVSREMIDCAKKNCAPYTRKIRFDIGDMHYLPYSNNSFDCVLCYNVIYHTSSDGIQQALNEIHRILVEGGEAYLTFISTDSWHWKTASIFADSNTFIKQHSRTEYGVPHFCVDYDQLLLLLSSFTISEIDTVLSPISVQNRKELDCHFHVLVQKPTISHGGNREYS